MSCCGNMVITLQLKCSPLKVTEIIYCAEGLALGDKIESEMVSSRSNPLCLDYRSFSFQNRN
jgi:hypothetical protein